MSRAATVELTAVEWGGGVVDAMKQIAAKQDKVTFNWVLHQGGSGKHLAFTPEEFDDYVYVPNFDVVLTNQDAWAKRWEDEIAPLL